MQSTKSKNRTNGEPSFRLRQPRQSLQKSRKNERMDIPAIKTVLVARDCPQSPDDYPQSPEAAPRSD